MESDYSLDSDVEAAGAGLQGSESSVLCDMKLGMESPKLNAVLARLYTQQQSGQFCDVKLCVGKFQWIRQCHKCVLAAVSPYFDAMFSGRFTENSDDVITIDPNSMTITNPSCVDAVIRYIYTDSVEGILEEMVPEVLHIAGLWLIGPLKNLCEYYLASNVNLENCMELFSFAQKSDCDVLEVHSRRFILGNLSDVIMKDEFYLNEREIVQNLIDKCVLKLGILPEDEVKMIEQRWKQTNDDASVLFVENEESEICDETTYICFKKGRNDHVLKDESFLPVFDFPFEQRTCALGVLFRLSGNSTISLQEFKIRLPNIIDEKILQSNCGKCDLKNTRLICQTLIGRNIFFGLMHCPSARFVGIMKFDIYTNSYELLPYVPGTIESKSEYGRNNILFFVKNTPGGKRLQILSTKRSSSTWDTLIIRSLEDMELVVVQQVPINEIPNGCLFYTSIPEVLQLNEELFFVFKYEILAMDTEGSFHMITPRDNEHVNWVSEQTRFHCVPLESREELLILVHVKYFEGSRSSFGANWKGDNCKYRLNAYLFHSTKGYRSIQQPALLDYGYQTIHTVLEGDSVFVIGKQQGNGKLIIQAFDTWSNSWSNVEESKVEVRHQEEGFLYTQSYQVENGATFL